MFHDGEFKLNWNFSHEWYKNRSDTFYVWKFEYWDGEKFPRLRSAISRSKTSSNCVLAEFLICVIQEIDFHDVYKGSYHTFSLISLCFEVIKFLGAWKYENFLEKIIKILESLQILRNATGKECRLREFLIFCVIQYYLL